jgi:hypothetical protein
MSSFPPCTFCRARQAGAYKAVRRAPDPITSYAFASPIDWYPACASCWEYLQSVPASYVSYLTRALVPESGSDGR